MFSPSGAFVAFAPGAALSMMNNGIHSLDQEIAWISVDEPGETDDMHPGSELVRVFDELGAPEPLEVGGADTNPQEAHRETNHRIEPFKRQVEIPPIETTSAISSTPEIF
jgi:hypothetical protein